MKKKIFFQMNLSVFRVKTKLLHTSKHFKCYFLIHFFKNYFKNFIKSIYKWLNYYETRSKVAIPR